MQSLKSNFLTENVRVLSYICDVFHYVRLKSVISILMHGVISLPGATSYDKIHLAYQNFLHVKL